MPDPGLATAADYSEALLTARRAKSAIALLLALMLVGQLAMFLLLRYDVIRLPPSLIAGDAIPQLTTTSVPATQGTLLTVAEPTSSDMTIHAISYATGVMLLGGVALTIVLGLTLCLIGHVMLVGRLIGVGRVTSALIWTLVLLVFFLFPWQTFLNISPGGNDTNFVTGTLWTWTELTARYKFVSVMNAGHWADTVLSWFRFVGAPVVALILVMAIQVKSNRGLRMALGEDELLNEMMRQQ